MRILFLNPSAEMGGAETSLRELLSSLRTERPDWNLKLLLGADGPFSIDVRNEGIAVRVLAMPPALARLGDTPGIVQKLYSVAPALGNYLWQLRRVFQGEKPDLIYATGFKMHLLSAWARPHRIPLIWHIHDYVRSRHTMSRLMQWNAKSCAAAITNSHSVAEDLGPIMTNCPVQTIYNAVDINRFHPTGSVIDLDELSGLPSPSQVFRVGLVATFAHWKGHVTFLEALAKLPADVQIRGYIIGGPVYQTAGSQHSLDSLQKEAERLGLGQRIGFTGFIGDAAQAMRALDVVVHASTAPEPFGMVIVEAMACGKPVIASNSGGATEILQGEMGALSHTPGNAEQLAAQILTLAKDPALRSRLGDAGRKKAVAMYSKARLGREIANVCQRVVENSDGSCR